LLLGTLREGCCPTNGGASQNDDSSADGEEHWDYPVSPV